MIHKPETNGEVVTKNHQESSSGQSAIEIELIEELHNFAVTAKTQTKGRLSVLVQLTEELSQTEGPWDPEDFIVQNRGQVSRLSGSKLKQILESHGIYRTLTTEGGRTSRGSLQLMTSYIELVNKLKNEEKLDIKLVTAFWVERVREYFNSKPFILPSDNSRSLSANINDLFTSIRARQAENPGSQYLGTVLQHLVGAKLALLLGDNAPKSHGVSVADSPTHRSGDFILDNAIIHCTTAPATQLIDKCKENLSKGMHPIIITLFERVHTALDLATDAGISGKIEVWDVQQFLTTNIYEWSRFNEDQHSAHITSLIDKYNEIITVENDPSLRIQFAD